MQMKLDRRHFLSAVVLAPMAAWVSCQSPAGGRRSRVSAPARFFFVSQGKTALINADGTGLRYLEFDVPNQATWQPADFFSDGHRVLFLSMEPVSYTHLRAHETPEHLV